MHASGMHVGVAGLSLNPWDGLNLAVDVHRFFADQVPSDFSTDLGAEVNLVASYQLTKAITVLVGLNRFYTGRFFKRASGSSANVDYAYLQTQIGF